MTAALLENMQEVHRWRGTPEQRALRAQVRKLGQFAYFDRQLGHPDWRGKKVLDFGGSDGNMLRNHDCTIAHEDYYCLDVIEDAVLEGSAAFPRAHWFHYDRYNRAFNPGGRRDTAIPRFGVAFDFILAYSVFTHTSHEDMHDLVAQLRILLAPGGVLAFTFEDPLARADWCSGIDGMTYDIYYTADFMRRAFPDAAVLPPVNGELQHCCVLRRAP